MPFGLFGNGPVVGLGPGLDIGNDAGGFALGAFVEADPGFAVFADDGFGALAEQLGRLGSQVIGSGMVDGEYREAGVVTGVSVVLRAICCTPTEALESHLLLES